MSGEWAGRPPPKADGLTVLNTNARLAAAKMELVEIKGPLWSERQGRGPVASFDHHGARRTFAAVVSELEARGSFQEAFGYDCVDSGLVPGQLGGDVAAALLIETGRADAWPVRSYADYWDDDTLFDMVEFLYRSVSEGAKETAYYHAYNACGWHYKHFDAVAGRADYREKVNRILTRYGDGFELTTSGQIERLLPPQVADLAPAPADADSTDEVLIAEAIRKYRSRAGLDRRDAVRNLADVLERLRPTVKEHLFSKDEGAMFQIANQYWIRHNDPDQRRDYDHDAWWDWLFHLYLSSIRLVQRLGAQSAE